MKIAFRRRRPEPGAWNLPEMQAARDRSARRLRVIFFLAALALIFTLAAWLVVRSSLFRMRSLVIEGEEQVSEDQITSLLHSRIYRRSYIRYFLGFRNLLIWPGEIPAEDLRMHPLLKSVAIEKNYWTGAIKVRVEERVPFAVWCFEKTDPLRCVWFDREGVILERSLSVEGNLIRRVSDRSQDPRPLRTLVLPAQFVENLFSILDVLERSGLGVGEVILDDLGLQEVRVPTREGPEILFSLRFPSHSALSVLLSLQKGENLRGTRFGELEYVDFRVENRAYFK